jgi:hypothetical protein
VARGCHMLPWSGNVQFLARLCLFWLLLLSCLLTRLMPTSTGHLTIFNRPLSVFNGSAIHCRAARAPSLPRSGAKRPMGNAALSNASVKDCKNSARMSLTKFCASVMRGWKLLTNVAKVVAASPENLQVGAGS